MEPKAINTLVKESEALKESVSSQFGGNAPDELKHLFNETSLFFQGETLAKWRIQSRHDELIDYIVYQYGDRGGESFWRQVLLDLRLINDEERALRMLEGLLPGRLVQMKILGKKLKKYPDNYLISTSLEIAKGEVLKVLYEYAYILENKSPDKIDKVKVDGVKKQIEKVLSA